MIPSKKVYILFLGLLGLSKFGGNPKMIKNKKGAGSGGFLALFGVGVALILLVFGLVNYGGFGQQSVVGPASTTQIQQLSQATTSGDTAVLKVTQKDAESDTNAQAAVPIYVYDTNKKVLISDNTSSSASTTTTVATSRGAVLEAVAFGSGYYGDKQIVTVGDATWPVELVVHKYTVQQKMTVFDENGQTVAGPNGGDMNMTISGVTETKTFDHLRIQNNNSNSMWNLRAFAVNLSAGSHIQKVTLAGNYLKAGEGDCQVPQSSRNDIDYLFCLPSAKALHAFDAGYNTGVMAFTADGTNPAELDSFIMLDESYFKSNKAGQIGKILSGMETDSVTPVDAGAPNQVFALNII